MCEAPSTWRASTWVMPPLARMAAYTGLIAAPGTPNAWVTPSRSRIATAASAAFIRAMGGVLLLRGVRAVSCRSAGLASGELLDEQQQRGVVEAAVTLCPQRRDKLGHHRTERDDHARFARRRLHDAEILVVQVDAESRLELAGQHPGRLAFEDRVAGQAPGEHLDRGFHVHAVGLEEHDRLRDQLDRAGHDQLVGRLDRLPGAGR